MLAHNRKCGLLSSVEKHLNPSKISPWRPLLIKPPHTLTCRSHPEITAVELNLGKTSNLKQNCWNWRSVSKNIGHWQTVQLPIPTGLKQSQTCLSELSQSPVGWYSRKTPGWLKDAHTTGIYFYKWKRLACKTDGCHEGKIVVLVTGSQ